MVCGGWGKGSNIPPQEHQFPEHLRARRRRGGRRRGSSTGYPQAAGKDREGKSLAAALRGDTDTQTSTHTRTTFSTRAANSSGSCLTAGARPSPRSRSGGDSFPSRAGERGTVPYLPAWRRGYVSMALAEREPGRERGRERGARTGLAGAGSAGGAKPPRLPPPLHWSRALPICRHHPGTLPACEPPPGTGRDPNPLPTYCPGFAVPSGALCASPAGALGWASRRGALMCGALRRAGVPRGSGTPREGTTLPGALGVSTSAFTGRACPHPCIHLRSGGRQVLPVTKFPLPLGRSFLWGLILW